MQNRKTRAAKKCAEHIDRKACFASVISSMKGCIGAGGRFSIKSICVVKASVPQRDREDIF